jgi:hypothetical protein
VDWKNKTDKGKTNEDIACARHSGGELCQLFRKMRETVEYENSRQKPGGGAKKHRADEL